MLDKIYKILIFGDTHGCLSEIPFIKNVEEYDYLLYLGDGYEEVERWIVKNKLQDKFVGVTGNCDDKPQVKRQKLIEIEQIKIFMTHGDIFDVKKDYKKIFSKAKDIGANIAMFGHTHYADNICVDGIYLFNPGSIMPRGRDFASVGYLEIQNNKILQLEHLTF